ncbi:MAG: PAS domain-containing protein [Chloroflexi bacterium]|nr:PAS domain-containing protein [Chloroflexota bacterium]
MLDALPDILVVLNAQRQVVYANEACLRILGYLHLGEVLDYNPANCWIVFMPANLRQAAAPPRLAATAAPTKPYSAAFEGSPPLRSAVFA